METGRIRLAEAMGWRRGAIHTVAVMGRPIPAQRWTDPRGADRAPSALPDPFTDANDDYAVLEWMRDIEEETPRWRAFKDTMLEWATSHSWNYRVGDWARAALAALDIP